MVKKTSVAPGAAVAAAAAAPNQPVAGKKKAAKKQQKKRSSEGDSLQVPKRILRRYALRAGSTRCSKLLYPVADADVRKTIELVVATALRSVTQDGRLTVKTRDIRRAMRTRGIVLY